MQLKEHLLSLGKRARGLNGKPVLFDRPVDLIIIHWIGPYPGHEPAGTRNWWENGGNGLGVQASAHYIVKGETVLQCLPLNEVGWHSGDTRNRHSIGIEAIPMNASGAFAPATVETLKELVSLIRKTHPGARLARHYDGAQKKDCPRYYTPAMSLFDGGGRVANPEGGEERWVKLRDYLDGKGEEA